MFDDELQRDEHKKISEEIEILRRPFVGIVSGYHELGYRILGPELDEKAGSVEIEGRLMVSPKLVWTPSEMQKTFGEIFEDEELMDTNLVGRVFAFPKVVSGNYDVTSENLKIKRHEWSPDTLIEKVIEEMTRCEITDTAVVKTPDVRFYPVAVQRFIYEILKDEFS